MALFSESDGRRAHARANTDADGRFEIADVAPGTWWLGPGAPYRGTAVRSRSIAPLAPFAIGVEILPGETRRDVELVAWRGLAIRGRVLDPAGAPAAGVTVAARSATIEGSVDARCDEEGAFAIGPLAPGEYTVWTLFHRGYAAAGPVTAPAGAEDVVLRLAEAGKLSGIVVDAATGAPTAATVRIGGGGWLGGASAKDDGRFAREGLDPGVYGLAAITADGRTAVLPGVEVRPGEEHDGLRLEVAPGARVTVRYDGPSTYANYTVYSGDVAVAFDGIHTGTSATMQVPAGALRVELAMRDGRKESRGLSLAPGAEDEVVFRLE